MVLLHEIVFNMPTKKVLTYTCLILTIFLSACSTTKYVPEGQYLLNKVSIKTDKKDLKGVNMLTYLRQRPNTKLFDFIPFNVALYSLSGRDTTQWINRFLQKIGDAPVIYDPALTSTSEKELKKHLANKGYENAFVSSNATFKKKKVSVEYIIKANEPYRIRNFKYRINNPEIKELIYKDSVNRTIHSGELFDTDALEAERGRLSEYLKNNGYYYFDKEYIGFIADSSLNTHQVDLLMVVRPLRKVVGKDTYKSEEHKTYRIRNINYYTVNEPTDLLNDSILQSLESIKYKDRFVYSNIKFIRPSALYNKTYIDPDSLYSAKAVDQTYAKLSALNVFKYLDISFSEVLDSSVIDSTASDSLKDMMMDCDIVVTPDKSQSFSFEVEGINNEGDFGIAGKFGYKHNNIFRGGESLKFQLRGANESIIGTRSIWDISTEIGLSFPNFFFPFLKKDFIRNNPANTDVYANFSYQIRRDYSRIIAGTGMRYRWQTPKRVNHQVDLIDFNYVYLPFISDSLSKTIGSSLLKYSYEDHLIMRTGYSISYSNQHLQKNRSAFSVRGAFEIGGNLLYGICAAANASKDSTGAFLVGNIPFAQYVKVDGDFTYNLRVDSKNSIAYHIGLGIGVPYLNSSILPFEKRYYGGGGNSVRGWSARTLGPGAYNPGGTIDYMKQSGDINLNLNMEYRTKLVWMLELALFIDAGNIWTLADEGQAGGQFKWNKFYEQIALGYGIGLRLNFEYFVIRLDWGIKAFDPGRAAGQNWRFDNTWDITKDTALHFAVGYPF